MRCAYCGSNRHTIEHCPKTASGQSARLHLRCTYCGARDHNVKACPKTWGGRRDDPKKHAKHEAGDVVAFVAMLADRI